MGNGCNKMTKAHDSSCGAANNNDWHTIDFEDEQGDAVYCNLGTTSSCTGSTSEEDSDTKHHDNNTGGHVNRKKRANNNLLYRVMRRRRLNGSVAFNRKLYHDRKEGMALLSQVCFNTSSSTHHDNDNDVEDVEEDNDNNEASSVIEAIDWDTLVKRAENLHAIEQNNLRKRRNRTISSLFPNIGEHNESKKRRRTGVDGTSDKSTSSIQSGFSINLSMMMLHTRKKDIGGQSLQDETTNRNELIIRPETSTTRWQAGEYEPCASAGSEDSYDLTYSKSMDCTSSS